MPASPPLHSVGGSSNSFALLSYTSNIVLTVEATDVDAVNDQLPIFDNRQLGRIKRCRDNYAGCGERFCRLLYKRVTACSSSLEVKPLCS